MEDNPREGKAVLHSDIGLLLHQGGGGIAVGEPQKKIAEIAEKLRENCGFFLREIAVGT